MHTVLVSACLLGFCCRYDGGANTSDRIQELLNCCRVIPVCPEQLGGLPTPRLPAERSGMYVITCSGTDVTEPFSRGAAETVKLAEMFGCSYALLKERSPSCGNGVIYDGTFSHTQIQGNGMAADALMTSGVQVFGESRISELLSLLKAESSSGISI